MTADPVRAFIAIPIPSALRRALGDEQTALARDLALVHWANPESMHVTLSFIGDLDPGLIPRLKQALHRRCAGLPPFELMVRGLGAFPNLKRPSVLWAGIDDHAVLQQLHRACTQALHDCGDPGQPDKFKEYHPHLTLGRFQQQPERQGLSHLRSKLTSEGRRYGVIQVREVRLYSSELHPTGAHHGVLASVCLRA